MSKYAVYPVSLALQLHRYRVYVYIYLLVKSSQVKPRRAICPTPSRSEIRVRVRVRVKGNHTQDSKRPIHTIHRQITTFTRAPTPNDKRIQMLCYAIPSYIEAPLGSLARDETASSALRSGDAGFRGAGERKGDPIWTRLCSWCCGWRWIRWCSAGRVRKGG